MTDISYDPEKRRRTLRDRDVDFEDAATVFAGESVVVEDLRRDYGEGRFLCFGYLDGRMVVVGYTPRGEVRHIFSMRRANAREQAKYAPQSQIGHGEG